jgi:hypothetical protein
MTFRYLPHPLLRACALALASFATSIGASAGAAAAQASAASAPPYGIVVDDAGVPMGPFYPGLDSDPAVLVSLGGLPVLLPLEAGKVPGGLGLRLRRGRGEIYFESARCAGKNWLDTLHASPGTGNFAMTFDVHGATIYLAAGPASTRTYQSLYSMQENGRPQCIVHTASQLLQPVVQVIDLNTVFAEPYSVQ